MGPVSGERSHASHLFIPVLKIIYPGAAVLQCGSQALQRVGTVQNQTLALQLRFGFKSLLPAPGGPLAAHGARLVLREALAVPLAGGAGAAATRGLCRGRRCRSSPWPSSRCRLSATCLVPAEAFRSRFLFGFFFFPPSGMLFHVFSALPVADETQRV